MTTKHEFDTESEAIAAGYTTPGKGDRNMDAPDAWGYDYQRADGQRTVIVWFRKERNAMGKLGAFKAMYPPA